jgi:hypothetical protein
MNALRPLARMATLNLTTEQRLARCATPMTKATLFKALCGDGRISINGMAVILRSIAREGGASCFILSICGPDNKVYSCFCRTVD